MAKEVDSAAARRAAQQARHMNRVSQAAQQQQQGKMSIGQGVANSSSPFNQILQERMETFDPARTAKLPDTPEEKREERTKEKSSTRRGKQAPQRQAGEEKVRETTHRDSREQSDSKEQKGKSDQKDSAQHAKEADQRVVSKQGQRDSGGGQQGRGQEGQQGAGQQAEAGAAKGESQQARPDTSKPMMTQMEGLGKPPAAAKASKAHVPKTLPKEVMQQIVSYARLMVRPGGEKEMELALRDEVFKGLRLRIVTKQGKIEATFITSSPDVRNLFQAQKRAIAQALEEKGLEVEGINVIMT